MSSVDRPLQPPPTVAQREAAEARLRTAAADGLLTLEEYGDRVGMVLAARSGEELRAATADLPVVAPQGPAGGPSRQRPAQRWHVAVLGGHEQRGRWRPAPRTNAVAVMGGVEMDLREAEVDQGELELNAVAVMGGIEIVVPDGVEVEMTGFAFMGGRDNSTRRPASDAAPLLRVRAYALMGGVEVRNPNKKELAAAAERGGATAIDQHPATWTGTGSGHLPARRSSGLPAPLRRLLGLGVAAGLVLAIAAGPGAVLGGGNDAVAVFSGTEYSPDPGELAGDDAVRASSMFGSVQVVIPEGYAVDVQDPFAMFGSVNVDSGINASAPEGAPTVVVRPRSMFGSVEIVGAGQEALRQRLQDEIDDLERQADEADDRGDDEGEAQLERQIEQREDELDELD
jgi:hypothetical protein